LSLFSVKLPGIDLRTNRPLHQEIKYALLIWLFAWIWILPWTGRAFFVDDYYQTLSADGIIEQPFRPFDFLSDDAGLQNPGWERGKPPRMVNPPLHHYIMAAIIRVFGKNERILRIFLSLIATSAVGFFWLITSHFSIPALRTTAVFFLLLSPAFWLTSYSLLMDATMFPFFLGGLWMFLKGWKSGSKTWLLGSGILWGFACLAKYTSLICIPLGLCGAFIFKRPNKSLKDTWTDLAITFSPLVILLTIYSIWNIMIYGEPHLWAAWKRGGTQLNIGKLLVTLTFFGGVFAFPAIEWFRGWRSQYAWIKWLICTACVVLTFALTQGGFPWLIGVQIAFWSGATALFLASLNRPKNPEDWFLWVWFMAGLAAASLPISWVAGRYFLFLLPPSILLWLKGKSLRTQFAAIVLTFVIGLMVAYADNRQAETRRWIAQETASFSSSLLYAADDFTMAYLKPNGAKPAFAMTKLSVKDKLLHQTVTMPSPWFRQLALRHTLSPIREYTYPTKFPVKVMDNAGSAGFYASAWGVLPFSIWKGPWERFILYEVIEKEKTVTDPSVNHQ